jgi:molybdopterin/thiamine biosynthesis adenylyltransferase
LASQAKAQELNQLVKVEARGVGLEGVEDGELKGKGGLDLALVVACDLPPQDMLLACARCRALGVPILTGASFRFWGFMFVDGGDKCTYIPSAPAVSGAGAGAGAGVGSGAVAVAATKCEVQFKALGEVLKGETFASLPPKHTQPQVYAWIALHAAAAAAGSGGAAGALLTPQAVFAAAQGLKAGQVSEEVCGALCGDQGMEMSPVAAIVGAMVANEAVKLVTGKDAPLNNFLAFDGMGGSGGRVYAL